MKYSEYISKHCMACGGNWTKMLMSGLPTAFPHAWEALDEDKKYSFIDMLNILKANGVVFDSEKLPIKLEVCDESAPVTITNMSYELADVMMRRVGKEN